MGFVEPMHCLFRRCACGESTWTPPTQSPVLGDPTPSLSVDEIASLSHDRPRASAVGERLWSAEDVTDVDDARVRMHNFRCLLLTCVFTRVLHVPSSFITPTCSGEESTQNLPMGQVIAISNGGLHTFLHGSSRKAITHVFGATEPFGCKHIHRSGVFLCFDKRTCDNIRFAACEGRPGTPWWIKIVKFIGRNSKNILFTFTGSLSSQKNSTRVRWVLLSLALSLVQHRAPLLKLHP